MTTTYFKLIIKTLICFASVFSFAQAEDNIKQFLSKDWITTATIDFSDTIPHALDTLKLKQNGDAYWHTSQRGPLEGAWSLKPNKYQKDSYEIILATKEKPTVAISKYSILQHTDSTLTVESSNLSPSEFIFVEMGSGIKIPDPDLGYKPTGQVLNRFNYNERLMDSGSGGSGNRAMGIVYLLEENNAKHIVILNKNENKQEWLVTDESTSGDQTAYSLELQNDFEGQYDFKIPKRTKAQLLFLDDTVLLEVPDLQNLKTTYISN